MPNFQYVAMTADGKKVKGERMAANKAELLDALKASGQYCMSVEEMAEKGAGSKKGKSFKKKELAVFFRQLSTMLKAGMTIVAALDYISRETKGARDWNRKRWKCSEIEWQ